MLKLTVFAIHATYKLRHAEKVKEMHKHSITYELGTIAAGIQERFYRMLKLYRQFASLEAYKKNKYDIEQNLRALEIMQGDYNEIRMEKGIYAEIKNRYESTTTMSLKDYYAGQSAHAQGTGPPPPSRRWMPKNNDYFE